MTEAVGLLVFACCVVGVCQTCHEDDAGFLTQCLHGHSNARRRAASDHDRAVFFDHGFCRGARRVRFRLRVACDILYFFAQNTVALQRFGGKSIHHAAVAFTVQVLNGEHIGAQFIGTLIGIWARLWYVKAECDSAASWCVEVACVAARGKDRRQCEASASSGTSLQHVTTGQN